MRVHLRNIDKNFIFLFDFKNKSPNLNSIDISPIHNLFYNLLKVQCNYFNIYKYNVLLLNNNLINFLNKYIVIIILQNVLSLFKYLIGGY